MSLEDMQRRDAAFMDYRAAGYTYDEHDGDFRAELDRHALLKVAQAAQEMFGEIVCTPTSGGAEGKWCIEHDRPMIGYYCEDAQRWANALAALGVL
jgi:hypothetical protein